ncbi:MAG TPA: ATP-grasp domain-containing protein [Parachlamydiaceae bacterium]|nr:ATP-grasp domain-containing protein [Parachlamydiaceae bacterium]
MSNQKKNFLLTAGRSPSTLDLARQLHLAGGHHVYIADTISWHVCRASNAVKENFIVPSPRFQTEEFIEALIQIIESKKIDCLIPTFEEILYISTHLDRFPKNCKIFSSSFNTLLRLHNKWFFYEEQIKHGIPTPETFLIKSKEDLKQLNPKTTYALKACYSRSAQSIYKIVPEEKLPKIEIEPHNPWIAQKWLEGKRFCTYSVCENGKVLAHSVYPVQIAIEGHYCLNFESVSHPKILEWIERFVAAENFTGQTGFDFFEMEDGTVYAIECNPRATHGLVLFKKEDRLDKAFTGEAKELVTPKIGNKKQIAAAMMIYGWKSARKEKKIKEFFNILFKTPDIVFNSQDLKPFLCTPIIYSNYIYESLKVRKNITAAFTNDFNWEGKN